MFLTAFVAIDRKGLIGANGKIPWHLPSDLKRFRRLTMGKPVIMGRKTWESLPGPLEGRKNIVVSRNLDFLVSEDVVIAPSMQQAFFSACIDGYEASVIGGSSIYEEFIDLCPRICLTVVDGNFDGDTYFPLHLLDGRYWKEVDREFPLGWGDGFINSYYELVEKRHPGEGIHEIWNWVDRKAYEKATGR